MRTSIILLLAMLSVAPGCTPKPPLPEPWYQGGADYYPPGPEYKLAREAAQQKAAAKERDNSGQAAGEGQ